MALTDEVLASLPKRQPQLLNIVQWPSKLLTQPSKPFMGDIKADAGLQGLLDDMVFTMNRAQAVGLAGVQVAAPLTIMVVQVEGKTYKIVNPRLVEVSAEMERKKEGCLSFMGLFIDVKRPKRCKVEYFDENGAHQTTEGNGLLAQAIQHEMDHLEGKTFLDRLPQLERSRALEKNKVAKRRLKAAIKQLK